MAAQAFKRLHSGSGTPQTTRQWVAKVIDNHWVESFILLLVVFDLIFVGVEAGIDAHLLCIGGKVVPGESLPVSFAQLTVAPKAPPKTPPIRRALRHQLLAADSLAGAAALLTVAGGAGHEPRAGDGEASPSLLTSPSWHPRHSAERRRHEGSHTTEVLACDTSGGHHAKHVTHICHVCSIAILCIFMVELLLKWWANPSGFLAGWCHKLDLFVVTVSLFFDVVVATYVEAQQASEERRRLELEGVALVTFLLILSRSWRVVRICHGFFEQYHHFQEGAEKPLEENAVFREALLRLGKDPDKELEKAEEKRGIVKGAVY